MADSVTVVEWGAGLVEQLADARLEVAVAGRTTPRSARCG